MKRDREALEKIFYFQRRVPTPTACVLSSEFFEISESVFVPSPKRFHDKRLEVNSLRAAIVEMCPVFGDLPGFDGRCWMIGGLEDDGFLSGRGHADVESDLPPINPVFHKDVRRAGESPWNKARHFYARIERAVLRDLEDFVANPVVAAPFHTTIVAAVEGVVTKSVERLLAVRGAAVTSLK